MTKITGKRRQSKRKTVSVETWETCPFCHGTGDFPGDNPRHENPETSGGCVCLGTGKVKVIKFVRPRKV